MLPSLQKLYNELRALKDKIKKIRERCKHPKAEKKACSSTGNWDRDDSYWYDCHCPRCNKKGTEPQ